MTYEYMTGMGTTEEKIICPPGSIAHEGTCRPTAQPRLPTPSGVQLMPFPPAPDTWRKSFDECKKVGGKTVWSGGWQLPISEQVRAGISSRWCPHSGKTRASQAPAEELERMRAGVTMRVRGAEWEKCCYPQSFIDRMEARDAQLQADYLASPEYQRAKAQREQHFQQQQEAMIRREIERVVQRRPAVSAAGSGCAEIQDGATVSYPIPEEVFLRQAKLSEVVPAGCKETGRFYDTEHFELCCSPQSVARLQADDQQVADSKEIPPWQLILGTGAVVGAVVWFMKGRG